MSNYELQLHMHQWAGSGSRLTRRFTTIFQFMLVFITRLDSSSEAWLRSYPAGVYLRLFLHYLFVDAIALVLNRWGKLTACGSHYSPTPYCLVLPDSLIPRGTRHSTGTYFYTTCYNDCSFALLSDLVIPVSVGLRFDTMLAFTWGCVAIQNSFACYHTSTLSISKERSSRSSYCVHRCTLW